MPHLAYKRVFSPAFLPVALTLIALGLSGCGRRGQLEAPEGARASGATQTSANRLNPVPARSSTRQDPTNRDPLSQTGRGAQVDDDEPPITAPNRPFILDSIL